MATRSADSRYDRNLSPRMAMPGYKNGTNYTILTDYVTGDNGNYASHLKDISKTSIGNRNIIFPDDMIEIEFYPNDADTAADKYAFSWLQISYDNTWVDLLFPSTRPEMRNILGSMKGNPPALQFTRIYLSPDRYSRIEEKRIGTGPTEFRIPNSAESITGEKYGNYPRVYIDPFHDGSKPYEIGYYDVLSQPSPNLGTENDSYRNNGKSLSSNYQIKPGDTIEISIRLAASRKAYGQVADRLHSYGESFNFIVSVLERPTVEIVSPTNSSDFNTIEGYLGREFYSSMSSWPGDMYGSSTVNPTTNGTSTRIAAHFITDRNLLADYKYGEFVDMLKGHDLGGSQLMLTRFADKVRYPEQPGVETYKMMFNLNDDTANKVHTIDRKARDDSYWLEKGKTLRLMTRARRFHGMVTARRDLESPGSILAQNLSTMAPSRLHTHKNYTDYNEEPFAGISYISGRGFNDGTGGNRCNIRYELNTNIVSDGKYDATITAPSNYYNRFVVNANEDVTIKLGTPISCSWSKSDTELEAEYSDQFYSDSDSDSMSDIDGTASSSLSTSITVNIYLIGSNGYKREATSIRKTVNSSGSGNFSLSEIKIPHSEILTTTCDKYVRIGVKISVSCTGSGYTYCTDPCHGDCGDSGSGCEGDSGCGADGGGPCNPSSDSMSISMSVNREYILSDYFIPLLRPIRSPISTSINVLNYKDLPDFNAYNSITLNGSKDISTGNTSCTIGWKYDSGRGDKARSGLVSGYIIALTESYSGFDVAHNSVSRLMSMYASGSIPSGLTSVKPGVSTYYVDHRDVNISAGINASNQTYNINYSSIYNKIVSDRNEFKYFDLIILPYYKTGAGTSGGDPSTRLFGQALCYSKFLICNGRTYEPGGGTGGGNTNPTIPNDRIPNIKYPLNGGKWPDSSFRVVLVMPEDSSINSLISGGKINNKFDYRYYDIELEISGSFGTRSYRAREYPDAFSKRIEDIRYGNTRTDSGMDEIVIFPCHRSCGNNILPVSRSGYDIRARVKSDYINNKYSDTTWWPWSAKVHIDHIDCPLYQYENSSGSLSTKYPYPTEQDHMIWSGHIIKSRPNEYPGGSEYNTDRSIRANNHMAPSTPSLEFLQSLDDVIYWMSRCYTYNTIRGDYYGNFRANRFGSGANGKPEVGYHNRVIKKLNFLNLYSYLVEIADIINDDVYYSINTINETIPIKFNDMSEKALENNGLPVIPENATWRILDSVQVDRNDYYNNANWPVNRSPENSIDKWNYFQVLLSYVFRILAYNDSDQKE